MSPETFFKNFGYIAGAPNGIKKLRELILQLAVSGKLGTQNSKDINSYDLILEIEDNKKKLIAEKKIRQHRPLPPISVDEHLCNIPREWLLKRLGDICYFIVDGSHNPPHKQISGIPMLSSQNVFDGTIDLNASRYISKEDYEKERVRNPIQPDDVFLTIVASIGRSAVVPSDIPKCAIQRSVALMRTGIYPYFLSYYFRSPIAKSYFDRYAKGTAQKGIYLERLNLLTVPVPPIAEQKRIVAKVEKLMAVCDELEEQQKKRHETRLHLNNSAIDKLLTSQTPKEFTTNWQRICDNFGLLYDHPDTVDNLRQAILHLAVQGKLSTQNQKDEPVKKLLEQIAAEKQTLIKKKLIVPKKTGDVATCNGFYEIPSSWQWVTLPDICYDWGQKKPDKEFAYIDVGSIDSTLGRIAEQVAILKPHQAPSRARKIVKNGSVIYSTIRPYLLNIAIVEQDFNFEPIVSTAFAVLHPFTGVLNRYLYYYLRSKPFVNFVESQMTGMAYPAISDSKLLTGVVPVPPFAEQKRIVAKVDQLMALCDELQTQLELAQKTSAKLTAAAVAGLITPN